VFSASRTRADTTEDAGARRAQPAHRQAVAAIVRPGRPSRRRTTTRMRRFCQRLAAYKIPVQVRFMDTLHSERFKKLRAAAKST
jgi:hypothetical protein